MDESPAELERSLRKSFVVIQQLKQQLADVSDERASEPIAVVGMSCRFPGGANTPEEFWNVLAGGVDTLREIPGDRWAWKQFFNADPRAPGTHYVRHGSFLDNVSDFDPEFFGISGKEADALDPQHRLLLEVSWEALEVAGLATSRLRCSPTGVYVGIGQNDYAQLRLFGGRPERISPYDGTGSSFCFASARLSFVLGLQGPNLVVDTACSSSLVALHLACQSLHNGECEQALAGGVHLVLSPEVTIFLSRIQALSPDGRSKAFSANADGYGRGEGCGMLVLKRLRDARRDGDNILALLRGTAVNHDGPSSGLTVPNGLAQQQLIREALRRARVDPADVSWIEAHGTGTSLGDPIEVAALADVFPREGRNGRPVYLSSVKTNIGHLEAASGIAGVIKAILALQHGALPPHLHCERANPNIDWDRSPFEIPTTLTPWPETSHVRRIAGVSAFGLGGTNAHVVLSDSDPVVRDTARDVLPGGMTGALPLVLSARNPAALAGLRDRYVSFLERTDASFADIAYTAGVRRTHFSDRLAVVATDGREAVDALKRLDPKRATFDTRPSLAFMFSGQGSQYNGMGRNLFRTVAVFRDAAIECAELVRQHAGWSPLPFLAGEAADPRQIDQTEFTQACLFTLQYALTMMWRAWGIEPNIVMGHSIGEYAAAWCAGVMSLEDAVRLVVHRGRLMQQMPLNGGMAALRMSEAEARVCVGRYNGDLHIAAINGPRAIVIAGTAVALDECLANLGRVNAPFMRLTVSHAFHSPLMRPMTREFSDIAERVRFHAPTIAFVPTGAGNGPGDVSSASYWADQILAPVRFAEGAKALAARALGAIVEIGPSPVLLNLARQSVDLPGAAWLASVDPADDRAAFGSLGELYVKGCDVRWDRVFDGRHRLVKAPTYAFTRRRCWVETTPSKAEGRVHWRHRAAHPFLGDRIASPIADTLYRASISASSPALLADHRVQGSIVCPAACFVEAALSAAIQHLAVERIRLTDIQFRRPLIVPESGVVELQTVLASTPEGCTIRISSLAEVDGERGASGTWTLHLSCLAQPLPGQLDQVVIVDAPADVISSMTGAQFYDASRARGIDYGPAFLSLVRLESHSGQSGSAEFSVSTAGADFHLPPAILDAALQALAAARPDLASRTFIPAAIDILDFAGGVTSSGRVVCRADGLSTSNGAGSDVICRLSIADGDGVGRVRLDGIRMRQIAAILHADVAANAPLLVPAWEAVPAPVPSHVVSHWIVTGDDDSVRSHLGSRIAARLSADGATVSMARAADVPGMVASHIGLAMGVCYLALSDGELAVPCRAELPLVQALGALAEDEQPRLLFVTRGAQPVESGGEIPSVAQTTLWGFARVVRNECPGLRCACVDLDPVSTDDECAAAITTECRGDDEDQVGWRNGARFAMRLRAAEERVSVVARGVTGLVCGTPGDLESLRFETVAIPSPGPGEVRVRVRAAGLNFKDVLHALGALTPPDARFGFDAAGVVEDVGPRVTGLAAGDRVMFSLTPGSMADRVNARADFACRMPASLTFAEAAGTPLAFLTAWHALVNVARVQAGDSVLIHAAAGGVGQAAIQIARSLGAEVLATASLPKQRFLREQGIGHVSDSRSIDFRDRVLEATGGRGVDVVLNCLTGDLIQASLDCLKQGGCFIEIGKAGIWSAARVAAYRADVRYTVFDLADVARDTPAIVGEMLGAISKGFAAGTLHPIRTQVFAREAAIRAFRVVSRARQVGKVVIEMPRPLTEASQGVHVVTGGFGALGRSLCRDLLARGVRNLALIVRRAPNEEQRAFLASLRHDDAPVVTANAYVGDVSSLEAAAQALRQIELDCPATIVAVYHTAGALADATIENQTKDSFAHAAAAKLAGAWNLHACTRSMDLERFVLFSSAAALVGTAGQSSYAAANAGLDGLAAHRRAIGLSALSINWGPWAGAGMAASMSATDRMRLESAGITPLREDAAWNAMAELLDRGDAQALVMSADWSRVTAQYGTHERLPSLFRRLGAVIEPAASREAGSLARRGVLHEIAALEPADRLRAIRQHLRVRVATILGRPDPDDIRPTQGFFALGLDSLTSLELRNSLQKELQRNFPSTLAFDYGTIEALSTYLVTQVPEWSHPADVPAMPDSQRSPTPIDDLSESDVAELLSRELRGEPNV